MRKMKLNLYRLCGIIICIFIYCVCVLSDHSMSKSAHAVNQGKFHTHPEELQRRREILNMFKESFAQNQKDWIETYSFNFGSSKIKGLSQNSVPFSEKSEFNEIVNPSMDDVKQKVIKNIQSIVKDTKQTDDPLYSEKSIPNDNVGIVYGNAFDGYSKSNGMSKISNLKLKDCEDDNVENSIDTSEKLKTNQNIKLNINSVIKKEIKCSSIKSFTEIKRSFSQEFDSKDIQRAKSQELPIISEELMERRRIVDAYISSHSEIQKNWVEPYNFNFKTHSIEDSNLNLEYERFYKSMNENDLKVVNSNENFVENNYLPSSKYMKNIVEIKAPLAHSEDLMYRQKVINSFLSQYGKYSKTDDWVDTYSSNFKAHNKDSSKYDKKEVYISEKSIVDYAKCTNNDVIKEKKNESSKLFKEFDHLRITPVIDCAQMTIYFNRWINKFLSKIENAEHKSISFAFSSEFVDTLRAFSSEKFDIVSADDLICGFISNATFNESYNYKWISFISSFNNMHVVYIIATSLFFIYCLLQKQFSLLFILVVLIGIIQHIYKKNQTIIAQKHSIASLTSSAHCINSLSEDSGFIDHLYEYVRSQWYNEDCKKYHEAVMVDNWSENNILFVIADLIIGIIIQALYPLSHALNYFAKESMYNTTLFQKILIIILIICIIFYIIPLYFGYKIKFPFFLGSIEPTYGHVGSQVEDVRLTRGSFFKRLFFRNSNESFLSSSNNISEKDVEKDRFKKCLTSKLKDTSCCKNICTNIECVHGNLISCKCFHLTKVENVMLKQRHQVANYIKNENDEFTDKKEKITSQSPIMDVTDQHDVADSSVKTCVANCQCAELNSLYCEKSTQCVNFIQCESSKGMKCKYFTSLNEGQKCIGSNKDFGKEKCIHYQKFEKGDKMHCEKIHPNSETEVSLCKNISEHCNCTKTTSLDCIEPCLDRQDKCACKEKTKSSL